MDSITHIVLGAVTGEAIAGKKLGKKAMMLGAIFQSIPDADIVAALFLKPADNLLFHRGITHSFLFLVITSLLLSFFLNKKYNHYKYLSWCCFIGLEMLLHLFTDACNAYGVGWFEPFSDLRISYHLLYVADPLFTLLPLMAFTGLIVLYQNRKFRTILLIAGCAGPIIYVCMVALNKNQVESDVKRNLSEHKITSNKILTTPTPFNSLLWYIVVEQENGFQIAYRSVFEPPTSEYHFHYARKNYDLIDSVTDKDISKLIKFSQGFYTIEKQQNNVVFNDLRFGQIAGWKDIKAPFTFHYYLNDPEANLTVMQRGRLSGWNRESFQALYDRIFVH